MKKLPEGYSIESLNGGRPYARLVVRFEGVAIYTSEYIGVYGYRTELWKCRRVIRLHNKNGVDR